MATFSIAPQPVPPIPHGQISLCVWIALTAGARVKDPGSIDIGLLCRRRGLACRPRKTLAKKERCNPMRHGLQVCSESDRGDPS